MLWEATETHDHLITIPGEAKLKFDEDLVIFCLTSSMVRPSSRGIAIGNGSCDKVSQLERIIR